MFEIHRSISPLSFCSESAWRDVARIASAAADPPNNRTDLKLENDFFRTDLPELQCLGEELYRQGCIRNRKCRRMGQSSLLTMAFASKLLQYWNGSEVGAQIESECAVCAKNASARLCVLWSQS
ncbi:MAG: hypothetical protein CXZ00_10795 [Acidobacteria bacterium]|nr:MAG: hypothetical protein CXZ00_10795 [Acidobacteriota bacterium]